MFLRFLQQKGKVDAKSVDSQDIHALIHDYVVANGFPRSYQNQAVNSLMLYFRAVDGLRLELDGAERPRREHRLPHLLSKEVVKRLLEMTGNAKHRTMLSLIYAYGLRRGELLALKLSDIDGERTVLRVRAGKGQKDRMLPISEKVMAMLREYYRGFRPTVWLIEGGCEGVRYGERSLQLVFNRAACRTGVPAEATLHWLSHSYAAHLLEAGTDIRYIQTPLGHKSSKSTEIYTHVSTHSLQLLRSPIDDI